MIMDERNMFAEDGDVTEAVGTHLIGDVINTEVAGDIGQGQPLYLVILVTTDFDSAADGASVDFVLASDDSASIATNGDASEHVATGVQPEADLTSGTIFIFALPIEGVAYEQYLGILAKITGEAVTAGTIDAFLTLDPHGWRAYADALTVT